jgi:ubiquinone/menaquinone biosynthesis C-methylase UbiE
MQLDKDVYDIIYKEFDKSRYSIWTKVKEFLDTIPNNSNIHFLDAGCGNGKYIKYIQNNKNLINITAIDNSQQFVNLCNHRYHNLSTNILKMDITNLNFINNSFDFIISIAVIHHLNFDNRVKMINELFRVLKKNGLMLISAWGLIDLNNHHLPNTLKNATKINDNNDYLIPFKSDNISILRFYHLYQNNELYDFIINLNLNLEIVSSVFDKDNFFIILKKLL